jgi:aromatic amino acid aminotransferase I
MMTKADCTVKGDLISLGGGLPDPCYFPFNTLSTTIPKAGHWHSTQETEVTIPRHSTKVTLDLARALQYTQGTGQAAMLKFAREHTEMVHHPPYADWQCLMTAGNTNAIDTCLRLFMNRGDALLIEEYSFPSVLECARPQGIHPVPCKLDAFGIIPEALDAQLDAWNAEAQGKKPHVLYIIPTGQNPTGSTLSADRRRDLYKVAQKHDLIILEDEPYYFLQMSKYTGPNSPDEPQPANAASFLDALVPSLLSLDVDGRVVRLDSFSKVIAPGARCGWLTGSAQLMERALRCNEVSIQCPSGFSQALLVMLLESWGHAGYLSWLVHLRAEYTRRRNALLDAMEKFLPKEYCHWHAPEAGMFVWMEIQYKQHPHFQQLGIDALEKELYLGAISHEVLVAQGSWFISDRDSPRPGLFFRATFASASLEMMQIAVQRFAQSLKDSFEQDASTTMDAPEAS